MSHVSSLQVAVLFEHFGPYHTARVQGAHLHVHVTPVELFGHCGTYIWKNLEGQLDIKREVLFVDSTADQISKRELTTRLFHLLDKINPDVLAVHGWSLPGALDAIKWARDRKVPIVMMSESKADDGKRFFVKEFIKKSILNHASAGLVGADLHRDYLVQLGIPQPGIFLGYDIVDNDFFFKEARNTRLNPMLYREKTGLREKFFFASNRFIEKKNLFRLIDAYHRYKQVFDEPWHLVLAGDGPLKEKLCEYVDQLSLRDTVHFVGFLQYEELPLYYGLASAFIHVSTTEQWGLVVNEAAASSLPLIVSNSCGCAPHLVQDGKNGILCDPLKVESIANAMISLSKLTNEELLNMGENSYEIVQEFGPNRFGFGLRQACEYAYQHSRSASFIDSMLLALLK